MSIEVLRYQDDLESVWNGFVSTAKNGLFFFDRNFLSYHADRFKDASLVIRSGGKVVGLFPASMHGDQIRSHGGLTFGGLIQSPSLNYRQFRDSMDAVVAHFKSDGIQSILYKAVPPQFHRQPAEEDLYWLFSKGAVLVRRDLSCAVELRDPIKYSTTRAQLVRKAKAADLSVRETDDIGAFHVILSDALKRHNANPVHTVAELELLRSRFPSNIRLVAAYDGSRMLSGTVLFVFGHVVHTQYMATNNEGRDRGALDLVVDHVLGSFRAEGLKALSFGISTESDGKVLNEGLNHYKESFGGHAIVLDQYLLEIR